MIILIKIILSIYVCAHPLIQINIQHKNPVQGDATWIEIKSYKEISSGVVILNGKNFKIFKSTSQNKTELHEYLTCIGVSRYIKPKKYQLKFKFNFIDQSSYETHQSLIVGSANFKKEYITLKPKKQKLSQDKPKLNNENQILGEKFNIISSSKKFKGPFIWPIDGPVSSPFGSQRVYNNKPGWAHAGIDLSAPKGTEIKATQSGTVVFAKNLKVHGNTVMINHGWGIISIYNHLDRIDVKNEQLITKGDTLGTVGSTGIATGDHLHFGISVQNIRVNPKHWIDGLSNKIY